MKISNYDIHNVDPSCMSVAYDPNVISKFGTLNGNFNWLIAQNNTLPHLMMEAIFWPI